MYGIAESILDNICIIKAIYRFNIIPIKIIASFFTEMEKAILNVMHKHRRPQIVKTIFSNMGNVGVITSLCYKPTLSTKNIIGLSRTGALSQIFSDTLKDVLVHVQQEEVSRTQYPHSQEVGYGICYHLGEYSIFTQVLSYTYTYSCLGYYNYAVHLKFKIKF